MACLIVGTRPGFNGLPSAAAYSQLAGVVAGVLFTGIVLLVSLRASAPQEVHRSAALGIIVPTFFSMLVVSLLFAIEQGNRYVCAQTREALAAGSLLGVSGIGHLAGNRMDA